MSKRFLSYVPHGIDTSTFFPITNENPGVMRSSQNSDELKSDYEIMLNFKNDLFKGKDYDFIVLYNNRNIRRKMIGDVILAYKQMCSKLEKEKADKCLLLLHTTAVDQNGTDLPALIAALCPEYNILIDNGKLTVQFMNYLYNISDVTINISSAEGFGLSVAESLMSGTPVVTNTLGGLQDQVGFKNEDGKLLTIDDFTREWGTNSDGRYKEHGEWAEVVFPKTISLVGSPPTPYIYDSRCTVDDTADALMNWYNKSLEDRKKAALIGRDF